LIVLPSLADGEEDIVMRYNLAGALSVLALVSAFPRISPARADECSREEMATAKPHFNSGAKAFRIGELQKAADEFKAAYEACASPLFLFNLGQTYRQLKDFDKALYFYKQFLSTAPPSDDRRADVQKWIDQLDAQIAARHPVEKISPATPTAVDPPKSAVAPNAASAASSPTPTLAAVAEQPKRVRKPIYEQWWLWTTIAVVAAGAGVAIAFGVEDARSSGYTAPAVTF
jgi:tetratricopeptide (TPR) repeat protein